MLGARVLPRAPSFRRRPLWGAEDAPRPVMLTLGSVTLGGRVRPGSKQRPESFLCFLGSHRGLVFLLETSRRRSLSAVGSFCRFESGHTFISDNPHQNKVLPCPPGLEACPALSVSALGVGFLPSPRHPLPVPPASVCQCPSPRAPPPPGSTVNPEGKRVLSVHLPPGLSAGLGALHVCR